MNKSNLSWFWLLVDVIWKCGIILYMPYKPITNNVKFKRIGISLGLMTKMGVEHYDITCHGVRNHRQIDCCLTAYIHIMYTNLQSQFPKYSSGNPWDPAVSMKLPPADTNSPRISCDCSSVRQWGGPSWNGKNSCNWFHVSWVVQTYVIQELSKSEPLHMLLILSWLYFSG